MRIQACNAQAVGRTPRIPEQLRSRAFSLEEARAAGLTHSALRGKSWKRIGARLYRYDAAPDNTLELIDVVRRTLPPSAVFVGRTAAWLHGLDLTPVNPVQVAVDRLESRAGLEIHHMQIDEIVRIKGRKATTLHRTLLDLCLLMSPVEALVAIDMAFLATLTDKPRLHRYAESIKGHPGVARLKFLADLGAPAESPMETRLRWLLIKAGMPAPEVQVELHDDAGRFAGRADLYYRPAHLIIEFDGGNHRERLTSDDRRQNALVGAGYRVLRFTATDVYTRPESVVAQVARILPATRS